MMTCIFSKTRLNDADTLCLWLLLCYHFSPLYPWPQSHMQAISVELPLAENDFMSDLLETERGEGGGCNTVCIENKLHKNRMLWLFCGLLLLCLSLMHQRQVCASAAPLLLLPSLKVPNPNGITSLNFLNLLRLFLALLSSLIHPASIPSFSLHHCIFSPSVVLNTPPSFLPPLSFYKMGALEPGKSADMSNVADTDSYTKTSAVSVEPAMTQAWEHTHTAYTELTHRPTDLVVPTIWNFVISGHYHRLILLIIIEKLNNDQQKNESISDEIRLLTVNVSVTNTHCTQLQ